MTDQLLEYGLIATVGMGATTIASAVVGDPMPVVIPGGVAFGFIGLHHIQERGADQEATAANVEQAGAAVADRGDRADRRGDQGERNDPLAGNGGPADD